jgi:hypothetical protein
MRREPRSEPLDSAGRRLIGAEETIALVPRATPKNARSEIQRLAALAKRRERLRPAFRYDPVPDLGHVRRELERLARDTVAYGRLGALHAARAEELELEARLVERIGAPSFAELARTRFRAPDCVLRERVAAFVEAALAGSPPEPDARTRLTASDDRNEPSSLVQKLLRHAAELALPLRVEIRPGQLAIAATGHGIVAIRPGVLLSADTAARIARHELFGHALPRARSVHARYSLLRAGTAGSVESEEGRALVIETRAGLFDSARRRELALRHLAALSVRQGADFEETVRALAARGAEHLSAIEIAARVHRGGGLARELAYLPAYHEVKDAFSERPELERWFERGRVSLAAARELEALESSLAAAPSYASNSMNTGV